MQLWDENMHTTRTEMLSSRVTALALADSGGKIVVGCEDGVVSLFDLVEGSSVANHRSGVCALAWLPRPLHASQ